MAPTRMVASATAKVAPHLLSAMLNVSEGRCALKEVVQEAKYPKVTKFKVKSKQATVPTNLKDTTTSLEFSRAMSNAGGITSSRRTYTDSELR